MGNFLDDLVGAGLVAGVRAFKKAQLSLLDDAEQAVKNQKVKVEQTMPPPIKVEVVDAEFTEEK